MARFSETSMANTNSYTIESKTQTSQYNRYQTIRDVTKIIKILLIFQQFISAAFIIVKVDEGWLGVYNDGSGSVAE